MQSFRGKVCVVTGAGSGIGRALSLALGARGARLAISDIDPSSVAETAAAVGRGGAEVEHYPVDVSDAAAVAAHAAEVAERFGAVNLVINNAGVAVSKTVLETTIDDFEWVLGANFWGVVNGTKAFLPSLIASGDGHLVNISSILGIVGCPTLAGYCAAKFAIRGFTESLRQELLISGAPVKVSCVHPGAVKTGIAQAARTVDEAPGLAATSFEKIARMTPERAAALILRGVERDRPRITVGGDARAVVVLQWLLGARFDVAAAALIRRAGLGA